MKRIFLLVALSASTAMAQEFIKERPVAPQPEPPRPAIEQNSNTTIVQKFRAAPNKFQLINPFAPREYGSGEQVVVADAADPNPKEKEKPKFWRVFSITF
jgi:hypothetical protein